MSYQSYEITDAIPPPSGRGPLNRKYPFGDMEIGQSFFVPNATQQTRNTARAWGKNHGRGFSCRTTIENGVKGLRVWRVS